MTTLTDHTTRRFDAAERPENVDNYELAVRVHLASRTTSEITRALHVAQYAARIGAELGLEERALWCVGALSAVDGDGTFPHADHAEHIRLHRRFVATGAKGDGWTILTDVIFIANHFETSVAAACASRCETSPADAFRAMVRDSGRFNPLVINALRRALRRSSDARTSPPLAA